MNQLLQNCIDYTRQNRAYGALQSRMKSLLRHRASQAVWNRLDGTWRPLAQKIAHRLPHREITLLILIGLLAIGCIDFLMTQSFQREQKYRQTMMAQQLQAQLQSAMEEHVSALIALNVVYQNFVDINQYDFQQYGEAITANLQGFRRLLYLTPKTAIHQVYPLSPENALLYGLELGMDPQLGALLKQARESRKPTMSNLMTFVDYPGSVLAVIPIYRNGREFLGYAVGEINLNTLWEPISHTEFLTKYQVQLQDSAGNTFFQNVRLKARNHVLTQLPFKVGDKEWVIQIQSLKSTFETLLGQRLGIWGAGLSILLLVLMLITASKRHKLTLDVAQRKFETIFNASPDGILLLDDKLHIQLSNPSVRSWMGLGDTQLPRKTFFDLYTCQCPHLNKCRELSFLLCTSEQFNEELPETLETKVTHATEGVTRTLRLNASKIQQNGNEGNARSGFICVLGDISTGKELERVKESYIATLTHDLKTPLIAQELVLDTILSGRAGDVTPEQHKLLSGANNSVNDLLEMVNSTLLFYKLESSHLPLQKQAVSLPPLMREVMETLRPLIEKRGLTFELETAMNLSNAWIDPIQMKRVFHNILSNAISHARRETPIRVSLQEDPTQRLLISIRNEGKGIPPSELPKIFEKYYSLSRKFKQIGTGLGLYISRRIVELHGGKIWAESELDKETRFFISLPRPQQV